MRWRIEALPDCSNNAVAIQPDRGQQLYLITVINKAIREPQLQQRSGNAMG